MARAYWSYGSFMAGDTRDQVEVQRGRSQARLGRTPRKRCCASSSSIGVPRRSTSALGQKRTQRCSKASCSWSAFSLFTARQPTRTRASSAWRRAVCVFSLRGDGHTVVQGCQSTSIWNALLGRTFVLALELQAAEGWFEDRPFMHR
jgi:hypothetical protein